MGLGEWPKFRSLETRMKYLKNGLIINKGNLKLKR